MVRSSESSTVSEVSENARPGLPHEGPALDPVFPPRFPAIASLCLAVPVWPIVLLDIGQPVRGVGIFAFLLLGPGLAVVEFVHPADLVELSALAIGLSAALEGLAAGTMLLIDEWAPERALLVLSALTVFAAAASFLARETPPPRVVPKR